MAIVTYFIMMLPKTADQSLLYEDYYHDDDVAFNFVDCLTDLFNICLSHNTHVLSYRQYERHHVG